MNPSLMSPGMMAGMEEMMKAARKKQAAAAMPMDPMGQEMIHTQQQALYPYIQKMKNIGGK